MCVLFDVIACHLCRHSSPQILCGIISYNINDVVSNGMFYIEDMCCMKLE